MRKQKEDYVATVRPRATVDTQFVTPTPRGWWTVAKWWAMRETDAFAMTPDPLGTVREDDERLRDRADALDVPSVFVPACPAMRAEGVVLERAYPQRLFEDAYPANP